MAQITERQTSAYVKPTISNAWINVGQRNGVDVRRKFKSLLADTDINDVVVHCELTYWEQELYPNGEVIKTELKQYDLDNVEKVEDVLFDVDDVTGDKTEVSRTTVRPEMLVMSGFIQSIGQAAIVNPTRQTIENLTKVPLNAPKHYTLHTL